MFSYYCYYNNVGPRVPHVLQEVALLITYDCLSFKHWSTS